MSTEVLLALSIVFSLTLAGVGWLVQFRLTRDSRRWLSQVRTLEDSLQAHARELKVLRDEMRASELMAMFLALAWPGDRTEEEIDAIARNAKDRLGSIPSREAFRERIETMERALSAIGLGIDRLTRTELVPPPLCGFED